MCSFEILLHMHSRNRGCVYIKIVIQTYLQIVPITVISYLTGWILVHGFVYNPVTRFLSLTHWYYLKLYTLYQYLLYVFSNKTSFFVISGMNARKFKIFIILKFVKVQKIHNPESYDMDQTASIGFWGIRFYLYACLSVTIKRLLYNM